MHAEANQNLPKSLLKCTKFVHYQAFNVKDESFREEDEFYLLRCGHLARMADGRVGDSPRVGAVLVHEGRIIGEGYHKIGGQAHAEVNCLASVRKEDYSLIPAATLYVSLEPCCIAGRSGACTNLIQRNGIKTVVFAQRDATPGVNGQSVGILDRANITVREYPDFLPTMAPNAYRQVFTTLNRPFVCLKFAQSRNGFLRPQDREASYWITNGISRRLVHRWRANTTAILVGGRTIVEDNPGLDTRLFPGPSPRVVIIDPKDRCTGKERIFQRSTGFLPILFSGSTRPEFPAETIPLSGGWGGALPQVLSWLHTNRIGHLTVEGGRAILHAFLRQGFWDEAKVFTGTASIHDGLLAPNMMKQGELISEEMVGTDRLEVFQNPNPVALPDF